MADINLTKRMQMFLSLKYHIWWYQQKN